MIELVEVFAHAVNNISGATECEAYDALIGFHVNLIVQSRPTPGGGLALKSGIDLNFISSYGAIRVATNNLWTSVESLYKSKLYISITKSIEVSKYVVVRSKLNAWPRKLLLDNWSNITSFDWVWWTHSCRMPWHKYKPNLDEFNF